MALPCGSDCRLLLWRDRRVQCRAGLPSPQIALPAQWHDSAVGSAASAAVHDPTGVWPSADWWHGFGSAKLDELIGEAERSNDDLAGAIARVREADAQVRIAGAALLPSLDVGATAERQRAQVSGLGPRVFNSFGPELSASYELDFWGKNRALRDAARAAAVASRYDQQTVALTVVSSVATTYLQALELRDRIEVAQQNLENGQKILKGFRLEQSVGTATGLDVAQQETTVAVLNAALPPLLQQFRQTVNALAVLTARRPNRSRSRWGRSGRCRVRPSSKACLPNSCRGAPMSARRSSS